MAFLLRLAVPVSRPLIAAHLRAVADLIEAGTARVESRPIQDATGQKLGYWEIDDE